jgi:hypothetical protein
VCRPPSLMNPSSVLDHWHLCSAADGCGQRQIPRREGGRVANSYERVVAALEHRQPDTVPYAENVNDECLIQALLPGRTYFEFKHWLEMDSVCQNRSSWSRDNVEYIDKERGSSATNGA